MADYHPLIARAVEGLGNATGEARRALYERARSALVAQLRGVDPPLSEANITRERLALTKLDILDGFDEIKVCTGYRLGNREIDYLPGSEHAQAEVEPIYETIDGWREATARARSWADLPAQAIKYVRRIEELIGCSAAVLSTSPEREDTILMQNPFEA